MSFNFTVKEFILGSGTGTPTFQFYKRGFNLYGGSSGPSWQDIILSGNGSLTLTNAKANGLNYLKLFGGTEQTGTPTPDTPVDIVSNNGVLKVIHNLIDLNAVTDGYYYNAQGNYTALSSARLTDYIPIEAGQSITIYFKSLSSVSNLNVRINIFNSNKVWQSQEVLQLAQNADGTKIIAPTANGYIRVSGNYTGANVDWNTAKVVYGEYTVATIDSAIGTIYTDGTTETVEIDTTGDTATAEMLLSVGNYQDVQSVLDGAVTRNVGVRVLDGTETIGTSNSTYTISITGKVNTKTTLLCSHFTYSKKTSSQTDDLTIISFASNNIGFRYDACATKEAFGLWLKGEYDAGHPVIVVYPLATPTTETVTGQPLTIQAGTNIVEITQASINNLGLEISYKGTI